MFDFVICRGNNIVYTLYTNIVYTTTLFTLYTTTLFTLYTTTLFPNIVYTLYTNILTCYNIIHHRSDVQEWLKSLGFPPSSLDELSRNQTVALARQVITHEGDVIRAYHVTIVVCFSFLFSLYVCF